MNIISIAFKDLAVTLRDRGALVNLFVLPLIFVMVFSLMGGSSPSEEGRPLAVVDLDDGAVAGELIAQLEATCGLRVTTLGESEAESQLAAGDLQRYLLIPAGFSVAVNANQPATLRLINSPEASQAGNDAIFQAVEGISKVMALETHVIASLEMIGAMQAASPEEYQVFTAERSVAQAESQLARADKVPLVGVEKTYPQKILAERESFNATQVSIPGTAVLFVFLAAQHTARSIYNEKKTGTFRRLLAAPLGKTSLLAGKMLPTMVTGLIQIVVIFAVGMFVLPLVGLDGFDLGNNLGALALVSLLMVLCTTSLGVLVAAIARTESQISGIGSVALWVMGAVGGSFIPTFFLSGFLGAVGKVVPHYWANLAFNGILVRGASLADIGPALAALAAFTVFFFAIGLWRFDFD